MFMKLKNKKQLIITQLDYIRANRKAAREEEILAHGKQIIFRSNRHKSKKKYDRKQLKKNIIPADEHLHAAGGQKGYI